MDLSDGEIKLELSFDIASKKAFYYRIIKLDTLEFIGTCNLCLEENEENIYLGNIGFEIFSEHQGHIYAYKASKLLADVAIKQGVSELTITTNPNNKASIKTIIKLGAHFIKVLKVPEKHRLYKQGNRYLLAYNWKLKEEGEKQNDRYKINKRKQRFS